MKIAICTIKIECDPDHTDEALLDPRWWGGFRMDLVHHINRFSGCNVKFFGWEAPSPELTPEDLVLKPGEHD